jgi:signal transduction histidine kinase/DNA-binding response OmpR family regulator
MVSTALLVASAVFVISISLSFIVQELAEDNAKELAKETAFHYAYLVKAELEVPLDEARAIAKIFESAVQAKNLFLSREEANIMLKHFIEDNTHFVGVYVNFEPDAFDGNDAQFVNKRGHDKTGRFIPYWARNANGKGFLEPLVDYDLSGPGDYYQLPKRRKKECVIEPYMYPIQGKEALFTSLVVPFFEHNELGNHQRFAGIVGIDITLDKLEHLVQNIKVSHFQGAYVTFYSAEGLIIGSKEAEYTGKHVKMTVDNQLLIHNVLKNQPFFIKRESRTLEQTVFTYGIPIEIGQTGTRWMVTVNIPEDELQASARRVILITVILGIVVILIAILAIYFLAKKWVALLLQINNHLKCLAQGQPSDEDIDYQGTDEVAEIIVSVRQLKRAMISTINQANAIATGDFSNEVQLLSEADQLGQALTQMTHTLRGVIAQTNAIASGDYNQEIQLLSEKDQLGRALFDMTHTLRNITTKNATQDWLKMGLARLNAQMSGSQEIVALAKNIISLLTNYIGASVGVFYLLKSDSDEPYLQVIASYAFTRTDDIPQKFLVGEGLVGQVALERQAISRTHTPEEYTQIVQSSLAKAVPRHVIIIPFLYENVVKGVIEIGSTQELSKVSREFLEQTMSSIGIAINTAESRTQMQVLLEQSQQQAEELQSQQNELQQTNEELRSQSEELQTQSEELQAQQEELRQTNEALEERTLDLEHQKQAINEKNQALEKTKADMEKAKAAIETKAKELELASKYKSEFLANMSHELRTPLNSMLILTQMLAENKSGNLNDKQVEYAQTVHNAGSDLLILINEILDLSKVEAGKIEVNIEPVSLTQLLEKVAQKFRPLAQKKGLAFNLTESDEMSSVLHTDAQRLQQIITNLLSNALKFTETGEVNLIVRYPLTYEEVSTFKMEPNQTIAISVTDTGIGIPKNKQQVIFEAFQQADGSTSRKYGGTGLGLSISRQLSRLLGGELTLNSEEGKGSTFTLYLPIGEPISNSSQAVIKNAVSHQNITPPPQTCQSKTVQSKAVQEPTVITQTTSIGMGDKAIIDDRNHLQFGDQSILIIEDDRKFSNILMEAARERHFKCLVAEDGNTGLKLVEEYKPHAIILDVGLPQLDGFSVMEKLKDNPDTRHIPVHFISASDQEMEAKKMGAIGYLVKPVKVEELGNAFKRIEQFLERVVKQVLLVTDSEPHQQQIRELVEDEKVQITSANTIAAALQHLKAITFDCMILDVDIEQGTSVKLCEQIHNEENWQKIPIILYTERDLTLQEEQSLQRCSDNLIIKAVKSPERLLDEITLFLHQIEANLSPDKCKMLQMVHDKEAILKLKKVLIVDDDIRNSFALTTFLEDKEMDAIIGATGKEGLELLDKHPDIALVLMDVMMPEMDGYEAMREIRKQPRFRQLPIIALTAKAMKGDKAKCIEAGANDYLTKPVDTDKLLSLMRVWLYR